MKFNDLYSVGLRLLIVLVGLISPVHANQIIDQNGIRISIPDEYRDTNPFFWIKSAKGLDSDDANIIVRFPAKDIQSLLPSDAPPPVFVTAILYLLDNKDKLSFSNSAENIADNVNTREGNYSKVSVEVDKNSDFYKIKGQYVDIFGWLVSKKPPPIEAADIVASCSKPDGAVVTSCKLSFSVDGIGVETTIRAEYLPYYERIEQYISEKIRSWKVNRF